MKVTSFEDPTVALPGTVNLALWTDFATLAADVEALFAEIESVASAKNLDLDDYIATLNRGFHASAGTHRYIRNALAQKLIVALRLLNQVTIEDAIEA